MSDNTKNLQKFEADLNIIQKLGDEPNTDNNLNAAELKEKFDEAANIIQQYINEVLIPYTEGKANGTHAEQHAKDGTDPVTPLSIDALPLAGNSVANPMTGDLYRKASSGVSGHRLHQGDRQAVLYSYVNLGSGDTYRALEVNAPDGAYSELSKALSFVERKNGVEKRYNIVHDGALGNLGLPQLAVGSYVGTGTYGQANPTSITFPFPPKLFWLHGKVRYGNNVIVTALLEKLYWDTSYSVGSNGGIGGSTGVFSMTGNTVSWYTTNTSSGYTEDNVNVIPYGQMNGPGETYQYIAIG